ncbi:MAG: hypothetical protein ACFCVH_11115 [Alphaproteobacteria bacterium]
MATQIGPLKKITVPAAEPLVETAQLSDPARALLAPKMTVRALLAALVDAGLLGDALRLLAYALPKREAVWWACQCARQAQPETPLDPDIEIIQASEAWVYRPTDQARRAAMELAMKTGFDRAAHWLAAAAFWSGGSIAPPEAPPVEPAESLTGNAVVGAVLLALVQPEPGAADKKRRRFLAQALDIADGGDGRKVATT